MARKPEICVKTTKKTSFLKHFLISQWVFGF